MTQSTLIVNFFVKNKDWGRGRGRGRGGGLNTEGGLINFSPLKRGGLNRGFTVKVSDTKYRRSPLIQGGLEIPVEVEVQMENSSENQQAVSKYQTLVAENYHEPVNGKYVDATPDILKALDCEDELTDFEDQGDEEVDTNTADLDSVVLETGSGGVPLGSVDVITIDEPFFDSSSVAHVHRISSFFISFF